MKHHQLYAFCLFIVATCFTNIVFAQQKIPLTILRSGHMTIRATVNGIPGKFIFDTGAGITVFTKKYADKLKNVTKQNGVLTAFRATGERMDVDLYTVDSLAIGAFVQAKPIVTIIDADILDCDGLISLMPFQHQPFTIDFKDSVLVLENDKSLSNRKSSGTVIPIFLHQNRGLAVDVFAEFLLNGKDTLQFLLDSGGGGRSFWINSRYLAACNVDITDTARVKKMIHKSEFDKDKETVFYRAEVPALCLKADPAARIRNFIAVFTDSLIYDGKVSLNWIGSAITFDLANKKMIIQN